MATTRNRWSSIRLGLVPTAVLLFLLAGSLHASIASAEDADTTCPVMHPDHETLEQWIQAYNSAPLVDIDTEGFQFPSPRGSLSLLSHLQYTPSDRNQGSCGNCWAWAGTGCLGIALDIQEGIEDRLSVQYVNSCEYDVIGKTCCEGGWLSDFADFYDPPSGAGQCIPWSNTNAHWQDSDASCDTSCSSISTNPNYPIASIHEVTIETLTVDQSAAIANIKSVLHQDRAVWFAFFLPDNSAWSDFISFWWNDSQSVVYDIDQFCGTPYAAGGGHAVLCVGYNDDDPDNPYWVMLNSWGTAGGNRTDGLFRVDMDMAYNCVNSPYYSFYWQTLDVTFGTPDITVSPAGFYAALPPDATQDYTLTIGNTGTATLTYTISDGGSSWLSENPASGSVEPGNSDDITVTIDATGLAEGDYNTDIVISSNDPDENPTTIPATLHVITVARELPPRALAGEQFDVIVTFAAPADGFNAIGFTDSAPDGWDIAVDTAWCSPTATLVNVPVGSPNTAEITWLGPCPAGTGFTALYRVQVPPGATPATYSFTDGQLTHYAALAGPFTADIGGDSQLELVGPPEVTTGAVTAVEETTATGNGNVISTGGEDCDRRGVCWSTSPGADINDSKSESSGSFGTGAFTAPMTGLAEGTTYYARAYAHNSLGYGYGDEVTFTTKPDAPASLAATSAGTTQIDLSWTTGDGAQKTMIRRSTTSYPAAPGEGDQVYFDTGTAHSDTGLTPGTHYYYSAWSWVEGSDVWSDTCDTADATTPSPQPDITVAPTSLETTLYQDMTMDYTITIGNTGTATLTYTISDGGSSSVSESPASGSVEPGNSNDITVTLDATGLAEGDYSTDIVISSNDPDENPTPVPITLHVITITRELPSLVLPGEEFDVTITFAAPADGFNNVFLTDSAPTGWDVSVDSTWCTPVATTVNVPGGSPNTAELTWLGPYPAGTGLTALYRVQVPPGATPGLYSFADGELEYHAGEAGPFTADIAGDSQLEICAVYPIAGATHEVNCDVLPGVTVTLYQDEVQKDSTVSNGDGEYALSAPGVGTYTVVAAMDGFNDATQAVEVAHDPVTLDFCAETGLMPKAAEMSYALGCVNHWLYPVPPCSLEMSTVLAVVNAWLYPLP